MTARRELLATAVVRLREADVPSPEYDAAELLAHVLGTTRLRLALVHDVPAPEVSAFDILVKRRAAREPLQHLTGVAHFRHVELAVGPGVFVPRPETELLVDLVLAALVDRPGRPVVADLCTGSGAIALAVATEAPGTQVHAVEVDPTARSWAERNLAGSGVRLYLADAADCLPELTGRVDVVVANPPYVPAGTAVPVEVGRDPERALYAGPDGLAGLRMVAATAGRLLRPGGLLGCEHDDSHGESAPALLRDLEGWTDVRDHHDLAGRPRFVTARKS